MDIHIEDSYGNIFCLSEITEVEFHERASSISISARVSIDDMELMISSKKRNNHYLKNIWNITGHENYDSCCLLNNNIRNHANFVFFNMK